jgi:hypothetical protein
VTAREYRPPLQLVPPPIEQLRLLIGRLQEAQEADGRRREVDHALGHLDSAMIWLKQAERRR